MFRPIASAVLSRESAFLFASGFQRMQPSEYHLARRGGDCLGMLWLGAVCIGRRAAESRNAASEMHSRD